MISEEIKCLKSILKSGIHDCPCNPFSSIFIKEKAPAKLKKVEIQHVDNDCLAIYPDSRLRQGSYSTLFDTSSRHVFNKACDAVILCEHKGKYYRIFCELKSDNPKTNLVMPQFKGTMCFFDYLDAILTKIYKINPTKRSNCLVVFNTKKQTLQTLDKRSVTLKKTMNSTEVLLNDRPLLWKVVNDEKIDIGTLISACRIQR